MSIASKDLSSPCLRGNHDGWQGPSRCLCDCHLAEVVWEDPPRRSRGRKVAPPTDPATAAALEARPGKWALVGTFEIPSRAANIAGKLRKDVFPGFPSSRWEAEAIRPEEGGSKLYLRRKPS